MSADPLSARSVSEAELTAIRASLASSGPFDAVVPSAEGWTLWAGLNPELGGLAARAAARLETR